MSCWCKCAWRHVRRQHHMRIPSKWSDSLVSKSIKTIRRCGLFCINSILHRAQYKLYVCVRVHLCIWSEMNAQCIKYPFHNTIVVLDVVFYFHFIMMMLFSAYRSFIVVENVKVRPISAMCTNGCTAVHLWDRTIRFKIFLLFSNVSWTWAIGKQ